ncbi:MAG: hypothetical protein IJ228_06740 [Succinivibrio sp.]|nr:hypothetical protein [Succinivibrio sp.]
MINLDLEDLDIGGKIISLVVCGVAGAVLTGFIAVLGVYGLIFGVDYIVNLVQQVRGIR